MHRGRKQKGFIHVIEIIIVSMLVFFAIMQFSYLPPIETDWAKTKLTLQGNDLLFSLDRMGVDWKYNNDIQSKLSGVLPENTVYKVFLIDEQGDIETIIDNTLPRNSASVSFYKNIDGSIYEVVISLGYLY